MSKRAVGVGVLWGAGCLAAMLWMGVGPAWGGGEPEVWKAVQRVRDAFNARAPEAFVGETKPKESVQLAPPYNGQMDSTWLVPATDPTMTTADRMPDAVPPIPNLAERGRGRFHRPPYPMVSVGDQEYTLEDRTSLAGELRSLFETLPPDVRLFFTEERIEVSGKSATVEVGYYFKSKSEFPSEESKAFLEVKGTLRLILVQGEEGGWKLSKAKEVVDQMKGKIEPLKQAQK